jgi:hypothetical protein
MGLRLVMGIRKGCISNATAPAPFTSPLFGNLAARSSGHLLMLAIGPTPENHTLMSFRHFHSSPLQSENPTRPFVLTRATPKAALRFRFGACGAASELQRLTYMFLHKSFVSCQCPFLTLFTCSQAYCCGSAGFRRCNHQSPYQASAAAEDESRRRGFARAGRVGEASGRGGGIRQPVSFLPGVQERAWTVAGSVSAIEMMWGTCLPIAQFPPIVSCDGAVRGSDTDCSDCRSSRRRRPALARHGSIWTGFQNCILRVRLPGSNQRAISI